MSSLEHIIREEIRSRGPMGFDRFMALALYHPELGYYASGRAKIGVPGDFYTSVSVGALFGELLAGQLLEMWKALGAPRGFRLIEQGANEGQLAQDILAWAERAAPDFFQSLHYVIIEPFSPLQNLQMKRLAPRWPEKVSWVTEPKALDGRPGVHFSNELIDAFPVALFLWDGAGWRERRVIDQDAQFAWAEFPVECAADHQWLSGLPRPEIPGSIVERRRGVDDWLDELTAVLSSGYILVIDYGHPRDILYHSARRIGTLACFHQHRRDELPLVAVGQKDITAHVDFTGLAEAGLKHGWQPLGYADQHHFLVGASESWLRNLDGHPLDPGTQKQLRTLASLMHPETMGTSFKFFLLGKGLDAQRLPSGFSRARPVGPQLGLSL